MTEKVWQKKNGRKSMTEKVWQKKYGRKSMAGNFSNNFTAKQSTNHIFQRF